MARDVTEAVKPPRAVFVPFRMGHHFGTPFHVELQRRIIMAAFGLIDDAIESPTIMNLDVTWARARREGKEIEAAAAETDS